MHKSRRSGYIKLGDGMRGVVPLNELSEVKHPQETFHSE
jgi:hypothetical protein